MKESLIDVFMNFKKQKMREICTCFLPSSICDEWRDHSFRRFLDTYIDVYYYQMLYTLDRSKVDQYDLLVVTEELNGICLEMFQELENAEILEDQDMFEKKKILTRVCQSIVELVCLLDITEFDSIIKREDVESQIDSILRLYPNLELPNRTQALPKMHTLLREWKTKERKFLLGPKQDDLFLQMMPYSQHKDLFRLQIVQSIKKISRNYRKTSIQKNFEGKEVSLEKTRTLLYLWQLEMLRKIVKKEPLKRYLIDVPESYLGKKTTFEELVQLLSNAYLQKHLVIVIPWTSYLSHKGFLSDYEKHFCFGVLTDFSHIADVSKKLESLEEISLFDYIIVKNAKSKDYNYLRNYEPSGTKTLLFQTLEEEEEV